MRHGEGDEDRGDDDFDVGHDEETHAGPAQGTRLIGSVLGQGGARIHTANNGQDESDHDYDFYDLKQACADNSAVRHVDVVQESAEETDGRQHKRRETDVLKDGRTGVKRDVSRLADDRKLHAGPYDTGKTEHDEEQPSSVPGEAMADREKDGDCESRDIDNDLGDRDAIAVVESHLERVRIERV
jgi:hypothetical protein